MSDVARFDEWRQRHALISLCDGLEFLDTAEGFAFIEQITTFFSGSMVGLSTRMGFHIDPDEVVNTAIERLSANGGRVAAYAASSDGEPWAYIATCLVGWVRQLWGTRSSSLDGLEDWLPAPLPVANETDLTPLDEVVNATFAVLAQVTPQNDHVSLLRLLGWLAANPEQRLSYEVHEKQAAHRFCPELTIEQVTAVMNIAWGARPRRKETSLMGAFLRDPEFVVSSSGTHARALEFFKQAFRAGAHGSKTLSDWR